MPKWDLARWQNERTSHWLVQAWAGGLEQVLAAADASGSEKPARLMALPADADAWQKWSGALWTIQQANVGAGARLAVGCSAETLQAVAQWMLGSEDLEAAAIKEAYVGLITHASGSLAAAASEHLGKPVEFSAPADGEIPGFAALGVSCHFALAGAAHTIALAPSELLLAALVSGARSPEDRNPSTALIEAPDEELIPELALSPHARQNLQMLLDVDLELSVSFGRTSLLLQEVLKLSSGSIVELNRSASDPVELLVNDAVVARGEVVVVDGNYGIRITEVVSPRERIRSLL